jgi:hypothetical protein
MDVATSAGFCLYSHSKLQATSNTWQPVIKGVPELPVSLADHASRTPLLKDLGQAKQAP